MVKNLAELLSANTMFIWLPCHFKTREREEKNKLTLAIALNQNRPVKTGRLVLLEQFYVNLHCAARMLLVKYFYCSRGNKQFMSSAVYLKRERVEGAFLRRVMLSSKIGNS